VSVLFPRTEAVDSFDHAGLFTVPIVRSQGMSASGKTVARAAVRPGRGRIAPTDRRNGGRRRYCSGCARETEHVLCSTDGPGSIPSIRWPAAEPAGGTTICLTCGQWRAASSQPTPAAWSSWPRSPVTRRGTVDAADPAERSPALSRSYPARTHPRLCPSEAPPGRNAARDGASRDERRAARPGEGSEGLRHRPQFGSPSRSGCASTPARSAACLPRR
jgi:hypothetical protein